MRLAAPFGLTTLLLAALMLLASTCADAVQRGANRPAPEPLRPPSPASCQLIVDIDKPVAVSVGRGSDLGEQVHCASSGEVIIRAELPPGQAAQAWVLIENTGDQILQVSPERTRADGSQVMIETEPASVEPGSSLRLPISMKIDPDTDFGTAFLHQIALTLDHGEGDNQTLILPIRLEAIDPDELFRQRFEVEPVLGQFL